MRKSLTLLPLMAFVLMGAAPYPSGTIQLEFQLSPAGSFVATSTTAYGWAVSKNGHLTPTPKVIVKMGNFKTGISLRDEHLRKHLETDKYPEATLTKISLNPDGTGQGTLGFRGVVKQLDFKYEVKGDRIESTFPLKISDFKIEGLTYMGVGVEDDVAATINLPVIPKK